MAAVAVSIGARLGEIDFLAWGCRLPFVASGLLVVGGYYIRQSIPETPDFVLVQERNKTARIPSLDVLREHWKLLLLSIGHKVGEVTIYYVASVFLIAYGPQLGFSKSDTLQALMIG